jgi:hypothetical protein
MLCALTESARAHDRSRTHRGHYGAVGSRLASVVCVALVSALLVPATAFAARGAQVPTFTLHRIQASFGDSAYLPTRLPLGYAYERWQRVNGNLVVSFKQRRGNDRFTFQVEKLANGTACDLGGAFHKTLQMDGNKIYYRGEAGEWIAWRCVTSPRTNARYLLSVHSRGPLPDVALARVAASGKRFAR